MKKKSVLWLLPLAVALLFGVSFDLAALTDKEEKEFTKLEATLAKKGTLGKSQARYDELVAKKAAEAPEVPPSLETEATAPVQAEIAAIEPAGTPAVLPAGPSAADSTAIKQADEIIGSSTPSDEKLLAELRAKLVKPNPYELVDGIPEWILDPQQIKLGTNVNGEPLKLEDYYVGIGSAQGSSDRVSIQMADARARQDIALQLGVQVRAMITDYAKNVGLEGGEFDSIQASETEIIGQQLAKETLTNLAVNRRQKTDNGTWWVVVTMPRKPAAPKVLQTAEDIVVNNTPPAYAEQAQKMVKLMDEQLAKLKDDQSEKATTLKPTVEIEN